MSKAVGLLLLLAAVIAAVWGGFMLVFNVVIHGIFHGPEIGFWQAGACVVLLGFVGNALRQAI